MYGFLNELRVIEGASFIAAPSCALYLHQMGAEVIRFDDLRRSPDRGRWPVTANGSSLYWEGLNKGKKSVALDLSQPEGRDIAAQLVTAPGKGSGLFVTNYPAEGFLSHARLSQQRSDLITLRVMGWSDGRQAVDYTVNSAIGIPDMTGPASLGDMPVNHVLPAWDLLAGAYGAFSLLAAEMNRRSTGAGAEIRVPLSDIALSSLGNLGQIAEVSLAAKDRERIGNDLFGAFGRDFRTADGRRVMIVAITSRQWEGLLAALDIGPEIRRLQTAYNVSFTHEEGTRFVLRDVLFPIVEKAVLCRSYDDLIKAFDEHNVCWGPYQSLKQAINSGLLDHTEGLFADVKHPSGASYPTPGAAATISGQPRGKPDRAPSFGGDTQQVLTEVLGYDFQHVAQLVDRGIILKPDSNTRSDNNG